MRESRSGLPVPALVGDTGETFLCSAYDPQKEAEKLLPFLENDDLVFFIGGPPDYLPALASNENRRVFVLSFPEETPLYKNRPTSDGKPAPFLLETADGWEKEAERLLFPFCSRSYRILPNRGWEAEPRLGSGGTGTNARYKKPTEWCFGENDLRCSHF